MGLGSSRTLGELHELYGAVIGLEGGCQMRSEGVAKRGAIEFVVIWDRDCEVF